MQSVAGEVPPQQAGCVDDVAVKVHVLAAVVADDALEMPVQRRHQRRHAGVVAGRRQYVDDAQRDLWQPAPDGHYHPFTTGGDLVNGWLARAPQFAQIVGPVLQHHGGRAAVEHGHLQPMEDAPIGDPDPVSRDAPIDNPPTGQQASGVEMLHVR